MSFAREQFAPTPLMCRKVRTRLAGALWHFAPGTDHEFDSATRSESKRERNEWQNKVAHKHFESQALRNWPLNFNT